MFNFRFNLTIKDLQLLTISSKFVLEYIRYCNRNSTDESTTMTHVEVIKIPMISGKCIALWLS